jgi:hypothetical protein
MFRQYHPFWQRFDQPDPYDGSYNLTDPQSLNRYSYVQNDPVNFVDPSGLNKASPYTRYGDCPPGSAVCGSGVGMGARPLLDGFNYLWYPHGETHDRYILHQPSDGNMFGPLEEFAGGLQEPAPSSTNDQQADFEGCAKEKIRKFRKAERAAIAKIAVGTVGFTVSTLTAARGISAIFGIASAPVRVTAYRSGYRALQLGTAGSVAANLISGVTVGEGFSQSSGNHEQLGKDLEDCKTKFTRADHSTTRLMFATPW